MNFLRAILITLAIAVPIHAQFATFWTAEENQLDIPNGGRVNTIAVNPAASNEMFVASETGGLFKTIDHGLSWRHIPFEKLPIIFTQSVAYLDSDTIFVSAKADFKTVNGGGVWRSDNGGEDWTPALVRQDERMSAYEISIFHNTVYVGTSLGLYTGFDGGSVWGLMPVFSGSEKTVFAVLVKDNRIYVGGAGGVRAMDIPDPMNHTAAWETPANGPSGAAILDIHAFGGSPFDGHALVVDKFEQLWVTQDRGRNWTSVDAPKGRDGCSGIAFIKVLQVMAEASEPFLRLYYSNRCELRWASALIVNNAVQYPAGEAAWQHVDVDHEGPRDMGVTGTAALLLGTSGGLHKAVATNVWRFVGGGRRGGYNALQINEVKGQRVGGRKTDLYIGTQDNNLWAWSLEDDSLTSRESEGHHIEMPREVDSSSDCKMTFALNNDRFKSGRHFANMFSWSDAPSDRKQAPALIRESHYVQNVRPTHTSPVAGLAWTDDCGREWDTFAVFDQEPRDLPRLGSAGDPVDP